MRRISLLLVFVLGCGGAPPSARKAQALLAAGDIDGAEAIVDSELARFPKEPHYRNIKIRVHLARGQSAEAVAAYREWRDLRGADDRGALEAMALSTLWRALSAPSADVRARAIQIIEELELEPLAEPVSRRLGDEDEVVRAAAAAAILRAHPDAPAILTEALRGPSPRARVIAVRALGRKVGRAAEDDLLRALEDPEASVRAAAIGALLEKPNPDDAPLFAAMAKKDSEGLVRAAALDGLATLEAREHRAVASEALADPYLGARLAALRALDAMGAGEETARRVVAGDDLFLALRAGALLGRKNDRSGRAALEKALASDKWTVRAAGLNAAVEITGEKDAPALVRPLASDPDVAVRLAAARALHRAGARAEAVAILVRALETTTELHRLAAATDLFHMRDPRGAAALAALATGATPEIRDQAVATLAGTDGTHDAVIGGLADTSPAVRLAAARRILLDIR